VVDKKRKVRIELGFVFPPVYAMYRYSLPLVSLLRPRVFFELAWMAWGGFVVG